MNNLTWEKLMRCYDLINNEVSDNWLGFKIVENNLMVDQKQKLVKRSWKDRLHGLPFRPWQKTRVEIYYVPKKEYYIMEKEGVIVCHPEMARKFKEAINNINNEFSCKLSSLGVIKNVLS
jgi:hypothetical protein